MADTLQHSSAARSYVSIRQEKDKHAELRRQIDCGGSGDSRLNSRSDKISVCDTQRHARLGIEEIVILLTLSLHHY